jgi:hypothetical protein
MCYIFNVLYSFDKYYQSSSLSNHVTVQNGQGNITVLLTA